MWSFFIVRTLIPGHGLAFPDHLLTRAGILTPGSFKNLWGKKVKPMAKPHVLIIDNSPRRLSSYWFGKWFRGLDCQVSAYYFQRKRWSVSADKFDALVISGSPASATEDEPWILHELDLIEQADRRKKPVLGVCFGSQLLARAYYGKQAVRRSPHVEIGWYTVWQSDHSDLLFEAIPRQFTSFQFHTEEVLPQPNMPILAASSTTAVQAFRVGDKPIWGVQFHLEVTPRAGRDLLRKTGKVYEPFGMYYPEMIAKARPSEATPQLFRNFLNSV